MADVQWIKLYTSFFDNKKIRMLRKRTEGEKIILFYLFLLTTAGRCNADGEMFFSERKKYNSYILAQEFECTVEFVNMALQILSVLDMVEQTDTSFRILDWEKHQNMEGLEKIRESSRIRSQRYREKRRLEGQPQLLPPGDVTVTSRHALEENTEKNIKEQTREENLQRTAPELSSGVVLVLPLAGGKEFPIYRENVDFWQESYPAVDVDQELREMKAWCIANPQKRKTEKGIGNFIINWLSKEQDSGKHSPTAKPRQTFQPPEF